MKEADSLWVDNTDVYFLNSCKSHGMLWGWGSFGAEAGGMGRKQIGTDKRDYQRRVKI